ncbi:unnamed protein product [Brachionus calyciflorus]|uniref:Uncharacterized protein n=1 Tax=Brachionus calyciflorus TaxID=104777 RepID=A0A814DFF7_9BILA|nr:unnamed protein product [Brachionus calyciflorus]
MSSNNLNELIDEFDNLEIKSGKITSSQRGHPQLCYDAKCYTKGNTIGEVYTIYFHNNEDERLFENKEKRRKLKEATMTCTKIVSNVAPRQILASVINEVKSPDAIVNMPTYDADRQALNRYKKSTRPNYPPEPQSLADIIVPEFLTITLEDSSGIFDQILIYDSDKEDPRRFLFIPLTWVGYETTKKTGRGKAVKYEQVMVKPRFDIKLWNIKSRINDCLPCTNSFVEAWHNAFSSMLNNHPSIYRLIDKFKDEQKKSEDLMVKLETCVQYKRNRHI